MLQRSDRTLPFSVRSEDNSASGRLKKKQAELTGPCLRPVMDHQTRPVMIPEDLDLSGINRTLGGSVRSLPPERPVSRKCAESDLLPRFLLCYPWGPHLTATVASVLDLTPYAAITEPPVRRALAAAPPQPSSPCRSCPTPPPPHSRAHAEPPPPPAPLFPRATVESPCACLR